MHTEHLKQPTRVFDFKQLKSIKDLNDLFLKAIDYQRYLLKKKWSGSIYKAYKLQRATKKTVVQMKDKNVILK